MPTAAKNSARNRRAAVRKPPRGSVRIECRKGSTGLSANLAVTFLDVSEGGMRLITKESLDPKAEVEVHISGCGQPKPLKRMAYVAWALPLEGGAFCVGLSFQKRIPYGDVMSFGRP